MRLIRPALALALLSPAWVSAQRQVAQQGDPGNARGTRLLRTPAVSATQIAFAYANNIWVADRAGGVARRLTSFQGQTQNPKFSPDGRFIAFTAEYGGNSDVYVVPSSGGAPKRLTWHPGGDVVQGWTPDGARIVFASTRASDGPSAIPRFWTVPVAGGVEEPMVVPRAYQGKISPDGRRLAYRMNNSWDEERRNYRGGQNRAVWILDLKSYDLETVPWKDTKEMDPVWVDDNVVYFLSDRDGVSNVWSYDRRSKQVAQVTKFTDFDVKALDAGAGAVVFEQAGYVHELDPKTGREHIVPITAAGDFPWMMPEWKDVGNRMTNVALSPTGKRAAVEARGEIFTIPAEKGDVRNLSHSSGSAEIAPAWSPDGKFVSYFSDRSGEYKLYIEAQDGLTPPREITIPNHKHYYTSSWSPDGKRILFHDTDQQVWVVDVASGQAKVIGNDPWAVPQRTLNPVWSPDGKWVAYAKRLNSLYRAIVVYNVETGESKQVTDGLADAMYPAWDASGKYLWFLASTDFGLGSQWLDMSRNDHEETFSLYAIVLKKTEPTPWAPESDEEGVVVAGAPRDSTNGGGAPAGAAARGTRGAQAPSAGENARPAQRPAMPTVAIDFDGIAQRTLAVPGIPNRMYSRLHAGAAGTVFYLEQPARVGGGGGFGGGGQLLHRYTLRDRKNVQFATNVADYDVSLDGKKLLYRSAGGGGAFGGGAAGRQAPSLFIVDADKGPPQANSGRLNVQLRAYIDPKLEFAQIFNEGWRNQRDYLYVRNAHGSDWVKMKQMYGQLLPYVNHRADLNYLLDNMGAEIAVGHSFVRGGDMPDVPNATGGLLGADFSIENGRYRITKIYDTESWNPDLRAPLAGPGIDVKVGDYVVAINGEELRAPDNIYRLLDGTANRQTTIAVNARPSLEGARNVVVVPVANEQGLRSRAWIEKNRRIVDSLSNGQLAYVYLPNTAAGGYSYFNRYYFAQQDRKGAILDERFNSGGQAADYIIDVLGRKFDGYFNNVAGDRTPFTSPEAGIWGPKVMIINEMAGSGGDLMPYMFQYRKLGPLVGKRTWGGLVHTADTPGFIDGGSMIAPRGGFISREGQWRVENEGTAPDIDVENTPKEVIAGHDPQLERAVAEAMRMLKEHPVERMTREPPAPTWGKRAVPVVP
jgi:tricorn protease